MDLKTAESFVLLAQSGISSVPTSQVTGDVGVTPIAATGITGFSLVYGGYLQKYSQHPLIRAIVQCPVHPPRRRLK